MPQGCPKPSSPASSCRSQAQPWRPMSSPHPPSAPRPPWGPWPTPRSPSPSPRWGHQSRTSPPPPSLTSSHPQVFFANFVACSVGRSCIPPAASHPYVVSQAPKLAALTWVQHHQRRPHMVPRPPSLGRKRVYKKCRKATITINQRTSPRARRWPHRRTKAWSRRKEPTSLSRPSPHRCPRCQISSQAPLVIKQRDLR